MFTVTFRALHRDECVRVFNCIAEDGNLSSYEWHPKIERRCNSLKKTATRIPVSYDLVDSLSDGKDDHSSALRLMHPG